MPSHERRERQKERREKRHERKQHTRNSVGGFFIIFVILLTGFITSVTGIAGGMIENAQLALFLLMEIALPYIGGVILFTIISRLFSDDFCRKLDLATIPVSVVLLSLIIMKFVT